MTRQIHTKLFMKDHIVGDPLHLTQRVKDFPDTDLLRRYLRRFNGRAGSFPMTPTTRRLPAGEKSRSQSPPTALSSRFEFATTAVGSPRKIKNRFSTSVSQPSRLEKGPGWDCRSLRILLPTFLVACSTWSPRSGRGVCLSYGFLSKATGVSPSRKKASENPSQGLLGGKSKRI